MNIEYLKGLTINELIKESKQPHFMKVEYEMIQQELKNRGIGEICPACGKRVSKSYPHALPFCSKSCGLAFGQVAYEAGYRLWRYIR
jgi:hypothetical protein